MKAAHELDRRRKGRASLVGFSQAVDVPGRPVDDDPDAWHFEPVETTVADHHRLILEAIERCADKRHGRLMIFMPPGSAKSTYASVVAPTYMMGRKPGTKIILSSYGTDLARRHGRKARQVAKQAGYSALWSGQAGNPERVAISAETSAADHWALTNGSEYIACGITAGVTGNRANGIIIDDPIKGREDADSPTIREKTWQAYKDDLLTRIIPGGWVVLVQTRWHEDDLAGRILPRDYNGESGPIECRDGMTWEVLCLPAECEREDDPLGRQVGEYLWPEWFDAGHWAVFQREARTWAALFQQRPRPLEGGMFKVGWFPRYNTRPVEGMVVQSWDTASKAAEINAPSVCTTALLTRHACYILHVWRRRVEYPDLKRNAKSLALAWSPQAMLVEDKSTGQSLLQELRAEGAYPVIAMEPEADKITRASTQSPICEAGLVHLPELADWLPEWELEVFGFPLSTTADQVDSLSQLIRWWRSTAIRWESVSTGQTRIGIEAFGDGRRGLHIDESHGYGRLSTATNTRGF